MSDQIKALVLPADGEPSIAMLDRGKYIESAHEVVGGWIQQIGSIKSVLLLADEDGLMKGLPSNLQASMLAVDLGAPACLQLVGTIILTGRKGAASPADVPEEVLRRVYL